jgi:hypothetical protein
VLVGSGGMEVVEETETSDVYKSERHHSTVVTSQRCSKLAMRMGWPSATMQHKARPGSHRPVHVHCASDGQQMDTGVSE